MTDLSELRAYLQNEEAMFSRGMKMEMAQQAEISLDLLLSLLSNDHIPLASRAAAALGHFSGPPSLVVPALAMAAASPHPPLRQASVIALGRLTAIPELSLPVLYRALGDSLASVRRYAIAAVGEFKGEGKKYVSQLVLALQDADPIVRGFAADILMDLSSIPVSMIPELVSHLENAQGESAHQIRSILDRIARRMGLSLLDLINTASLRYRLAG